MTDAILSLLILAWFLWAMWFFAKSEARHDDDRIDDNLTIYHGKRLKYRLMVAGLMFAAAGLIDWFLHRDFAFLLFAPMGWAWWTAWFRWMLNKERGLDWRYIAPWSNNYDRVWYALSTFGWMDQDLLELDKKWYFTKDRFMFLKEGVHRAGLLAYTFEALVFAGACWWWIIERINN